MANNPQLLFHRTVQLEVAEYKGQIITENVGRTYMDKDWSDKNKEFQKLITKEATFKDGIKVLLELRETTEKVC